MTSAEAPEYLIGVRLRDVGLTDDYKLVGFDLHVGEFCVVETGRGTAVGEARRPKRELPDFKREQLFRRVLRTATTSEIQAWRALRDEEKRAIETCQARARGKGLQLKVIDVEIERDPSRLTVCFNADARVDFRDLVRELAREFHARIEMRQIGARDTTKIMDGIGPCGRQLCCSSHLRKFEPISVKMAKTQDMPLTDSRLLGNCGRLKCCLLYEFSTYEEFRARLPRVNTPCDVACGGGGCMTGKVKSIRVLAQSVVVRFPDNTEAEVPLDQLTWEGRAHIKPQGGPRDTPPGTPPAS